MHRDVHGLMEQEMVFKQPLPALVAIGARVEIVAFAKYLGFGALEEGTHSVAEFFLTGGVIEIHVTPRELCSGACPVSINCFSGRVRSDCSAESSRGPARMQMGWGGDGVKFLVYQIW